MLEIVRSTQFKKDLKKIIKQGKDLDLLQEIVEALQRQESLLPKFTLWELEGLQRVPYFPRLVAYL